MWDSDQNRVGVVHAGWRGTLGRIAAAAVASFKEEFMSGPEFLHVAMGPAIGGCCYEIGHEVANAIVDEFPDAREILHQGGRGRMHLNLTEANRRQLIEAGVPGSQIYAVDLCTSCDNDVLYSYRREGKDVGRLFGVIGLVPGS
jgi:YfiH family protein